MIIYDETEGSKRRLFNTTLTRKLWKTGTCYYRTKRQRDQNGDYSIHLHDNYGKRAPAITVFMILSAPASNEPPPPSKHLHLREKHCFKVTEPPPPPSFLYRLYMQKVESPPYLFTTNITSSVFLISTFYYQGFPLSSGKTYCFYSVYYYYYYYYYYYFSSTFYFVHTISQKLFMLQLLNFVY